MADKAVRARISGKVQGVWYRAWTQQEATRLGIRGWVRNCRDGSVEALFVGPSEDVDTLIDMCRQGPPDARVDGIETREVDDLPDGPQFEVRR